MKVMKKIKINNREYCINETGIVIVSLNFPYKYNRQFKYNTPREEYIDKNNWKEKLSQEEIEIKLINSIPNIEYDFIEYSGGDKELKIKVSIEDLQKYNFI
jgi:hypothetical protein